MRWLVLASSLSTRNGYGVLCRSLVGALERVEGISLDVFTGDHPGRWWLGRGNLKSERISIHPRLWRWYVLFDLINLLCLARGRYDGVLILVEHYAAAGWIFSRWRKSACVVTQCGTYAVKLPLEFPYFKRILAAVDRVVPISRYTQRRMEEEGIKASYSSIPLGVDRAVFRPLDLPRRREILFVGNLKARKGLDFLLEALRLARLRMPDIRLKVVGKIDRESQAFKDLSARITEAGLLVEFTGTVSEQQLVEAYAGARLNALPSKSEPYFFEGFGLIHVEANACGTLTVGTLDSGNEDAIQEGFGYLVRYGDAQALVETIVSAMTVEPYPSLQVAKVRTWDDVARDYCGILLETSDRRLTVHARKVLPGALASESRQ